MTRRRRQTGNSLADHVADGFLGDEIDAALKGLRRRAVGLPGRTETMIRRFILQGDALEDIGRDTGYPPQWVEYFIELGMRHLRTPETRHALADYHYSAPPSDYRLCPGCFNELEPKPEGQPGRRKKYCGPACRQRIHRRRNGRS